MFIDPELCRDALLTDWKSNRSNPKNVRILALGILRRGLRVLMNRVRETVYTKQFCGLKIKVRLSRAKNLIFILENGRNAKRS